MAYVVDKEFCVKVIDLVKNTALFIQNEKNKSKALAVETKSLNSFLTHVDKGSEKILVEGLSRLLPEAGFIAEEGT